VASLPNEDFLTITTCVNVMKVFLQSLMLQQSKEVFGKLLRLVYHFPVTTGPA